MTEDLEAKLEEFEEWKEVFAKILRDDPAQEALGVTGR